MPDVTIRSADGGDFQAYLAMPASGSGPGVVVIQEILGVNDWVRSIADGLAAQGYVAMAPDLFWRIEPGIALSDTVPAEWKRGLGLFTQFDVEKGVADMKAAVAALRRHPACTGKVGSVGYCLGGKLAYLMATRGDTDCNVGYYGVGIQDLLDEAPQIRHPLLLHLAQRDQYVPAPAQEKIIAGLARDPHVTLHFYLADHGFARAGSPHYNSSATERADKRTADFLRRHLFS